MPPIKFTVPAAKPRQGVPGHLAARYLERTVRSRKGRGAYSRKGRQVPCGD